MHPDLDAGDIEWKFQLFRSFLNSTDKSGIKRVLEIGSGSGKLLEKIADYLNADGVGMDISFTILKKAESMSKGIHLIQAGAEELPVKADKFDTIYFADLLEHLLQPGKFLSQFTEVNSFMMIIPLESGWISDILYHYRRFAGKTTTREIYGHINRWNRKELLAIISKNGLRLSGHKVLRGKVTQYQSWRGKAYGHLSELIYSLSPALHERLFGGWTFVGLCRR